MAFREELVFHVVSLPLVVLVVDRIYNNPETSFWAYPHGIILIDLWEGLISCGWDHPLDRESCTL